MPAEAAAQSSKNSGRLAAEFVVIVVGVLVALGVDAARGSRDDRLREAVYLQQLQTDLTTTAESLANAISLEEAAIENADRVIQALNASVLPAPDSLGAWMLGATASSATFHPTMGTITALVESGELRLLRNDELRQRVLQYHNAVATALRVIDGVTPHAWRTLERVGQNLSWAALVDPAAPQRFPIEWDALACDPTFHGALYDLRLTATNRVFALRTLLAPLRDLEAQLTRQGE